MKASLNHSQEFFQPCLAFFKLGLTVEAIPLMELDSSSTCLLVQNTMAEEIVVPKSSFLGWFISTDFHGFELGILVIGQIPSLLICEDPDAQMVYTKTSIAIAIFPVHTVILLVVSTSVTIRNSYSKQSMSCQLPTPHNPLLNHRHNIFT